MEPSDWMAMLGGFVGGFLPVIFVSKKQRKEKVRDAFLTGLIASGLILAFYWVTGG